MAEEIETVLLIRSQIGVQAFRQFHGRDAFEFRDALAQFLGFGRVGEALQFIFIQVRDMFHADFLRHGNEAFHAHLGHRLVRALDGVGVQFHPAGIRQFHKAAGRGGKPFQIRLGQFQAFRLPFGGNGQPVNAAAFDNQPRLERCAA